MKPLVTKLISIILVLGVPLHGYAGSEPNTQAPSFHEIIITTNASLPEHLAKHARKLGSSGRYFALPIEPRASFDDVRKSLLNLPMIRRVEPNYLMPRKLAGNFDDPLYASQWYHTTLQSEVLFELTHGGPEVRVAVIDSAIELSHPEFHNALTAPLDVYDEDNDPSPVPGDFCVEDRDALCDEHGTAVTGVIAARANNALGIVGFCADCTVIPIRLVGEYLAPISADIEAFEHAIAEDAWVINNSWGYAESLPVSETLKEVIQRASTEPRDGKGAVVVFAAGNDNREIEDFELAAIEEVLSVTATDQFGNPTPYTNTGSSVDLAAPSATVSTSVNADYTSSFGGTSAAAPVVSGIAALILSIRPELTSTEVRDLLRDTAFKDGRVQFDTQGHHKTFGYGFVDLVGLKEALTESSAKEPSGCQNSKSADLWPLMCVLLALAYLSRRKIPSEA